MLKTALYTTALTILVQSHAYAQGRGGGHATPPHGPSATAPPDAAEVRASAARRRERWKRVTEE